MRTGSFNSVMEELFMTEPTPSTVPAGQPTETPKPGPPPAATEQKPAVPPSDSARPDVLASLAKERDKRQKLEQTLAESFGIKLIDSDKDNSHYAQIQSRLTPLAQLSQALTGIADPAKGQSEIEQITARLTKHEAELTQERSARWRAEIAHEKGLTPQQAARLVGSSRDDLAADAEALKELFPTAPTAPGIPKPDPSQGGQGGAGPALDSQIAEAQKKGDWRAVIALQNQKFPTQ